MEIRTKLKVVSLAIIASGAAALSYSPKAEAAGCYQELCGTLGQCQAWPTFCATHIPPGCTKVAGGVCTYPSGSDCPAGKWAVDCTYS